MTDIETFEAQKKKVADINHKIAVLQGSREEVLRQLKTMGVEPSELESVITTLRTQITTMETELKGKITELTVLIDTTNAALA